jgi:nicotinamidase-related amidase
MSSVALVLIDVINAFDFEGSESLVQGALRAAPNIDRLARRAREQGVPVIYVNDNFGRWRSDFRATVEACGAKDSRGREVVARLKPQPDDYFILKPMHSGFHATALEPLLSHLGVHTLVLAGFAANICLIFTANDAHMHGYQLVIPSDCTAANEAGLYEAALEHARVVLAAEVGEAGAIDFRELESRSPKPHRPGF